MENPIVNGYKFIDDSIMYGVDKTVRGYNWVTGGTKDELANNMISTGVILGSVGSVMSEPISGYLVAIPCCLFYGYKSQKINTLQVELERKALERRCVSLEVESLKKGDKFFGPAMISLATIFGPYHDQRLYQEQQIGLSIRSAGWGIFGLSYYIMRTDNLPPRKNVFSRAADMLGELFDEFRKPALQPVRAD